MEQLTFFEENKEKFAKKVLEVLNSLNTLWKDTLEINNVELKKWEHTKTKKRNLMINISTTLPQNHNQKENYFTMWNKVKDTQRLNDEIFNNKYLKKLNNDDDFSISLTPWHIYIFYHNFDFKEWDK